jgi:hypothetical protein
MNGEYAALAARLRTSLSDVDRVVARAEALSRRAQETGDDGFWDGVALNLHGFYAGLEQIFEDIARTLEGSLPTGSTWHQALLLQLSSEVADLRPAVLSTATRQCLDEYRSFRHIVRNVYTFNLRPARLLELVNGLRACRECVAADLSTFASFLDRMAQASGSDAELPPE